MGKSSSQAPAAPDPKETAQAQAAANIGTARVTGRMNRNNVSNPYYTSTWTDMGDRTRNVDGSMIPPPTPTDPAIGGGTRPGNGRTPTQAEYDHAVDPNNPYGPGPRIDGAPAASSPRSASGSGSGDPNDPQAGEQEYYNQDRWSNEVTLNPEEQRILDQSRRLQLGVGGMAEGQLPRIQQALDSKVGFDGLPARSTGVDYGALQSVNPNFDRGTIQNSIANAGGIQTGVANAGAIRSGLLGVGNNIQTGLSDAGDLQRNLNVSGQWDLGGVGGPDRSMDADWGAQLQGVTDASFNQTKSRLDPQWQQATNDFGQSLADRGVPVGSDDYNKQMDAFQRQKTDAYQTAQNNATMSGNALLGTLGGLELGKFGAENAAQGQEFGQTTQQRNDLFSQALQAGNFGNEAQKTAFGQNLAGAEFGNRAQGQLFSQDLAGSQFANSAQQQRYGQNATDASFANQAQNQSVQQQQQQQQLALQLRQQGLTEQQVQAALAEAARTGGYNERMAIRNQPLTDAKMLMGMGG